MEGDPHRVPEGLLIAAYAVGAHRALLHINGGARLPLQGMARALAKAQAAGLIGDRILGSAFSLHVEIRRGPRGFFRGQERALLASIEGQQAAQGTQPLLPSESRLWAETAVVSNLENLAAVPPVIATHGAGRASAGRSATRLFGVSGSVNRPGIVEVGRGVTLRTVLCEIAAGLRDQHTLKGVRVAGRSDISLSPESLDTSLESVDGLSPEPVA